jgi:hypothetical protein
MAERYKAPKNMSEDDNSDKVQEKYSFDDLDKEVGLGDILKEKDSVFMVLVKKVTFVVIIIIVSIMVFFASFTIGKMMFMQDQSELTTEGIPSENIIESTSPDTVQTANGQEVALSSGPIQQGAGSIRYREAPDRDETKTALPQQGNTDVVGKVAQAQPKALPAQASAKPQEKPAPKPEPVATKPPIAYQPLAKPIAKPVAATAKPVETPVAKIVPVVKPAEKPVVKVATKPKPIAVKPVAKSTEFEAPSEQEAPAVAVVQKPVLKQVEKPAVAASTMIVAGTFSKVENADIVKTKLTGLGFSPSVIEIQREGKTLLRVIAGTFSSSEAAKKIQTLRGKGIECFAAPAN